MSARIRSILTSGFVSVALWLLASVSAVTAAHDDLVVLTTTTTQDSGILKHIMEAFERKTGIKGLRAAESLKRIADKKAVFVSRGDQSGTHVNELAMWRRAGVVPKGQPWYRETGQGQGLTMEVAAAQQGYAYTDRGTYLVFERRLRLPILVESDPSLYNIYHVMPVDPAKFPKVNATTARAFADYVLSPEGQQVIGAFGKAQYGRSLFVPAAGRTEDQVLSN